MPPARAIAPHHDAAQAPRRAAPRRRHGGPRRAAQRAADGAARFEGSAFLHLFVEAQPPGEALLETGRFENVRAGAARAGARRGSACESPRSGPPRCAALRRRR